MPTDGDIRSGPRRRHYGRRLGRPLRSGQRESLARRLPDLAVSLPSEGERLDVRALFRQRPGRLWLEIGYGGAEHMLWQAASNPDAGIIGCEPYVGGLVKAVTGIERLGLANLRLFSDDARLLLAALPDAVLDRAFILFPDPWPKTRHHKRRIVSHDTLDALARTMVPGAELRLASDHAGYVAWMLQHLRLHPAFEWTARVAADFETRPTDWPGTRYEAKAVASGRSPVFLRFRRRSGTRPAEDTKRE